MQENNTESASPGNQPDISNPTRPKQKTKRPTQTNTGRQPETTQPGASKSSEGTNETPAPPKPEALLRGDNFYFKIPRFTIVESRVEDMFFTFYKFNQYREILVVLGSQGEAEMTPGEKISVVPENGAEITAEVKYVSKTPQVEDRYDWYFTIPPAGLERLANEKFKGVRLQYANGRPKRTYNFTNRGSKDLKRKANEALKKLDDQ